MVKPNVTLNVIDCDRFPANFHSISYLFFSCISFFLSFLFTRDSRSLFQVATVSLSLSFFLERNSGIVNFANAPGPLERNNKRGGIFLFFFFSDAQLCMKRAETTRAISQGPSNRAVYVISSPQQPPLQTVRRLSLLVKDSLPRDCPRQLVPSPRECFLPVYNIRFLHFFSSGKPRNGVEEPCRLLPLAESSAGESNFILPAAGSVSSLAFFTDFSMENERRSGEDAGRHRTCNLLTRWKRHDFILRNQQSGVSRTVSVTPRVS